jgi:hypothetical protein
MAASSLCSALAAAVLALAGCSAAAVDPNCTDELRPGIKLTREDSTTGAGQPFTEVVAVACEEPFADTARVAALIGDPSRFGLLGLAFERPGSYRVTVRAAGYAPWVVSDVRVDEEPACHHVITRSLAARLRPLGP